MNDIIRTYMESNSYQKRSSNYTDRIAVIIETRNIPHLKWVIDNINYHTGWDVMLFYYNNNVSNIDCLKVKLPFNIKNNENYSDLLKSIEFWKNFDQEHILIFQSDSFMLREGIDEYLHYDFVGAPWYWANDPNFKDSRYPDLTIFKNGGNGGFSIRKKSSMIHIIESYYTEPSDEDRYINEDMFFAKYLEKYPDLETAKKFCVETMFYENPMAVHAIDKYLSSDKINKILN